MSEKLDREREFSNLWLGKFPEDSRFASPWDDLDDIPAGVHLVDESIAYSFDYEENPIYKVFGWQGRLYQIKGVSDSYGSQVWWPWYVREVTAQEKTVTVYE